MTSEVIGVRKSRFGPNSPTNLCDLEQVMAPLEPQALVVDVGLDDLQFTGEEREEQFILLT